MARHWLVPGAVADPAYRRYVAHEMRGRRRVRPEESLHGPGHVVEFTKGGRSTCGVVTRSGRVADYVLGLDGKESFVHHTKILDRSRALVALGEVPHTAVESLRVIHRERERLRVGIDPYGLWEVASVEDRAWTLDELSDLWFGGGAGLHGRAALLRVLCEERTFARRGCDFRPLPDETVAAHREEDRQKQVDGEWLEVAASWLRALADGVEAPAPANPRSALDLIAAKVLFGEDHPEAERASRLVGLARLRTPRAVSRVLVAAGYWNEDANLDLLRHGTPVTFTDEAAAEAQTCVESVRRACRRRVWLRRVYAFAEPGEQPEMAFSIRRTMSGFAVGVHIAAPSLMVRHEGAVHTSAAERAVALRLPEQTVPLLPPPLVSACSLSSESVRPTLTAELRFDKSLRLLRSELTLSRVRVSRCMTEEEAAASAEDDRGLLQLCAIASELRQRRMESGAVVLPEPWVRVRVTGGQITLRRTAPDNPARLVGEELSLLANSLVARFCVDRGIPAVFRSTDPCPHLLDDPRTYDPVSCRLQHQVMPPERLGTAAAPNCVLGVDVLTPADRPLSRYLDLLMHEQILAGLRGDTLPYTQDDLDTAVLNTLFARETARDIERRARRYWLLRYAERYVGYEVPAVVLEQTWEGYRVELVEMRLWVVAHGQRDRTLRPGTPVSVRVNRVDARDGIIHTEVAV